MLLLYLLHGAEDRAGLRRGRGDAGERLRVLRDHLELLLQPRVARDTAERALIALEQLFGAGEGIVDALTADAGGGSDLAERIVLIVVQIEQLPLFLGEQLAIIVVQQLHRKRVGPHDKPPPIQHSCQLYTISPLLSSIFP